MCGFWVNAVPEHADLAFFVGEDEVDCVGGGESEVVGFDVVFAGEEGRAGGEVLLEFEEEEGALVFALGLVFEGFELSAECSDVSGVVVVLDEFDSL